MNNIDTKLQDYEQQFLMLTGEQVQAEQQVESIKVKRLQTEGRILELREIKQQAAEEKDT